MSFLHRRGNTDFSQQAILVAILGQFKENQSLKKLSRYLGNTVSSSENQNLSFSGKDIPGQNSVGGAVGNSQLPRLSSAAEFVLCSPNWLAKSWLAKAGYYLT